MIQQSIFQKAKHGKAVPVIKTERLRAGELGRFFSQRSHVTTMWHRQHSPIVANDQLAAEPFVRTETFENP